MLTIDHVSGRTLKGLIEVNVVFTLKNDQLFSWFERKYKDWVPQKVCLDPNFSEAETDLTFDHAFGTSKLRVVNQVEGFIRGEQYLTYLEKFQKFQYRDYFRQSNTIEGIVLDLKALQKNPSSYELYYLLEAASRTF